MTEESRADREARERWIVEMPSEELFEDLGRWQEAYRVIKGLGDAFVPVRGNDAIFVALVDAQVRAKQHIQYLQKKADRPEPEEPTAQPTALTAVNRLLSEASVLLAESHPPTEEEEEAQLEARHAITDAGLILAKELERQAARDR